MASAVADVLRTHKQAISDHWERVASGALPPLAGLSRPALLDHLPEILDALATWVESATEAGEHVFDALADGHALQRLGFGIELHVLTHEYACLRKVLHHQLMGLPATGQVRADLARLDEGLDRAIYEAVRRYVARRDELRDRFIGILGHDLRNPLATIATAAHVLRSTGGLPSKEQKRVEIIGHAAARMSRMVGDVLDFARGHLGGGIPTTPVACDVGEICRAVVDELHTAHPDRLIRVQTTGELTGTFDRDRLFQTFGNLISNALQHGQDPVEVTAAETDDKRAVVTRISNRGPAIAPEVLAKIFDPFVGTSEKRVGLGLGLYIVAQIARAHGATCDVSSSLEETSFTIRWPRTPRSEMPRRP